MAARKSSGLRKSSSVANTAKRQANLWPARCVVRSAAPFAPPKVGRVVELQVASKPSPSVFRKPEKKAPKYRSRSRRPKSLELLKRAIVHSLRGRTRAHC